MTHCQHHWLLSQPNGDVVVGRCKLCKLERVFPARLDQTDRGNDYQDLNEVNGGRAAKSLMERIAS